MYKWTHTQIRNKHTPPYETNGVGELFVPDKLTHVLTHVHRQESTQTADGTVTAVLTGEHINFKQGSLFNRVIKLSTSVM